MQTTSCDGTEPVDDEFVEDEDEARSKKRKRAPKVERNSRGASRRAKPRQSKPTIYHVDQQLYFEEATRIFLFGNIIILELRIRPTPIQSILSYVPKVSERVAARGLARHAHYSSRERHKINLLHKEPRLLAHQAGESTSDS